MVSIALRPAARMVSPDSVPDECVLFARMEYVHSQWVHTDKIHDSVSYTKRAGCFHTAAQTADLRLQYPYRNTWIVHIQTPSSFQIRKESLRQAHETGCYPTTHQILSTLKRTFLRHLHLKLTVPEAKI